jgi:cytosine/adenosine deaminase-related metal-dependent hydrolase
MNPIANTWQNWREALAVVRAPHNVKRTLVIAVTVGSVFFAMNQLGTILAGHAGTIVWLKAAMTYLTPLIVSNVGVLSATRRVLRPLVATAIEPNN